MSRRPASFSADDVARAFRGASAAGAVVARCEIDGGRIILVTTEGAKLDAAEQGNAKSKMTKLQRWQAEENAG